MLGITLKKEEVVGAIRKRGIAIDKFTINRLVAIISEDGVINKIIAGTDAIVVQEIMRDYTDYPISLERAAEIAELL